VAAYLIAEDLWYILPAKKIKGMWSIGLYPGVENAKHAAYKEAWHWLRGESVCADSVVPRIEACVEAWGGPAELGSCLIDKEGGTRRREPIFRKRVLAIHSCF
jgi:hypothetical protein